MKKLLYCAAALAMAFFAGSCQQENLEPVVNGSVTYTITLPETVQTKGESGYDSYDLYYEVYKSVNGDEVAAYTDPLFEEKVTFDGSTTTIALDLLNDQDYTILFWANKKVNEGETSWFDVTNLRNVKILSANSNNDDRDAFCGMDQLEQHDGTQSKTVELKRPFAQVNIATLVTTYKYDITPQSSYVEFSKIPVAYNVFTGKPVGENTVVKYGVKENDEHVYTAIPGNQIANDYTNVAMNYVLVPESNIDVYYEIVTPNGTVKNNVPNVPVKPNYRTNIIGNLLTSNATYTVELKPGFEIDGKENVYVENDGVVKNINNDYEISNANGLAYAINNLFANGGNFYLTAAEYDMTGLNVNPVTIASGETLNIYGETPVVTRSTTSLAGITIKGLDNIINIVSEGANVSISGVKLVDEGSVLVETNNGTLVVSESTGEEAIVSSGNNPVEANNVDKLASLKAALATGVKTINITADIADIPEVLLINNSVIINGNNKTVTTSANRAFRLTTSNIEVTFNNLNILSTAVRVGTNDVRGVSIDTVDNITLTLNNCSHKFKDSSANDWAYALNVTGGKNHKVTVIGGEYEGANVINVRGESQTVTVKNATLNSTYPDNDIYYGSCIWVQEKQGSSVYAEGNTFNGNNAIAFNLGTGTALEEKDNVDNTKMVVAKVGEAYYTSLAKAFAAAESGATVKVLQNTEMTPVTVPSGKTITLDLNGKTVSNITTGTTNPQDAILVKGNLTVKNGTLTTEHKGENLGWSAQSSIFNITGGGIVNLNDVVAKNLGGTDMGFVAHLNNWGEATFTAENCTLEANYVAVRVFNSGYDKNNVTIKNSTLKGGNYAFWVHNYTVADFGTAEKAIAQQKLLNFNLTEGNTFVGKNDTPIRLGMTGSMYLAADQIGNLPTYASVDSEETLIAALKNASNVNSIIYFSNDITISNKWDNRFTGAKTSKPIEINGNGKVLKFTGEVSDGGNYHAVFRFENDAIVKNLKFDLSQATNQFKRLRAIAAKYNLLVENCEFVGNESLTNTRAIIYGEGQNQSQYDAEISISDCIFVNWTRGITDNENAKDVRKVTVAGNTFENAHAYMSAYESVTFTGNTMNNSCVNIKSYSAPESVIITVNDNELDENQTNNY